LYNEDRKSAFIEQHSKNEQTQRFVKYVFASTLEYEKKYNLDVCQLPHEVILEIASNSFGFKHRSIQIALGVLLEYEGWCKSKGYEVVENIDEAVEISSTSPRMQTLMVASPYHLQTLLNKVFDPEDFDTVDILYRTYFWFAFAGIDELDAVELRVSDIDLVKMLILGKYEIYREGLQTLHKACFLKKFNPANYSTRKKTPKDRLVSEYVFRSTRSEKYTRDGIRTLIRREMMAANKYGYSFFTTYDKIKLSGIFYREFERERIGIEPTLSEIIEDKRQKGYKLFAVRPNSAENKIRLENIYDYNNWKKAFGLTTGGVN
jgi:hypothetical protein